jgi:hypothetical protein
MSAPHREFNGVTIISISKAMTLGYKYVAGPYFPEEGNKTSPAAKELHLMHNALADMARTDHILVDAGMMGIEIWRNSAEMINSKALKKRENGRHRDLGGGMNIDQRRRAAP